MRATLRAIVMAFIAGTLGLTLAVVPTNFSPEQAHAAIAAGVPDPINVLPSVLTGAKSAALAPTSWLDNLAVMTYQAAKNPNFWKAAEAVKAGTPNTTEAQLVADAIKKFKLPAFKPQMMVKAAGGVGAALTTFDLGLWVGNGALDVVGISRDAGTLCTGTAGNDVATWWTSNFNHVDCAAFSEVAAGFVPNQGIVPGLVGALACTAPTGGACVRLLGSTVYAGGLPLMCFGSVQGERFGYVFHFALVDGTAVQPNMSVGQTGPRVEACRAVGLFPETGGQNSITDPETVAGYGYKLTANPTSPWVDDSYQGVVATSADPERYLECRIKLSNGANLVAQSQSFREGSGAVPPVVCPDIPTGAEVEEFSIWEVGGGESHELVPTTRTTPEYDHSKTTYPECMDGTCMLDLQKQGVSCFTIPEPCADWHADPEKESTYTCRYGTHTVSLTECGVYKPTFKPQAKPTGQEYADPVTGQPLANPAPAGALDSGVRDPSQPRNCWPTGWGVFNPVEWVQRPVQCVIEWAFVPRSQKLDEVTDRMGNAWRATTLAKATASLEAVVPALQGLSDGGCEGIKVDLSGVAPSILGLGTYYFMPACPGDFFYPWAGGFKTFIVIAITFLGGFAVKAQISRFVSNGEA